MLTRTACRRSRSRRSIFRSGTSRVIIGRMRHGLLLLLLLIPKVEGSDIVGRYVKAPAKRETTLTIDHIETSVC